MDAHLDPEIRPTRKPRVAEIICFRIWRWFVRAIQRAAGSGPLSLAAAREARPAEVRPTRGHTTWTLEGCEAHPLCRGSCAAAGRWCLVVRPHGGRRLRRLGRAGRSGRYRRLRGRGQRRGAAGTGGAGVSCVDRAAPRRRAPQERAAFPERAARRARAARQARPARRARRASPARRGLPARQARRRRGGPRGQRRRGQAGRTAGAAAWRRRGGRRRWPRRAASRLRRAARGTRRPRRQPDGNGRRADVPAVRSCSRPNIRLNDDTGNGRQTEVALAAGPDGLALAGWMDERADARVRVLVLHRRRR